MAFADIKRSQSAAHKFTFRVTAIDGSDVRTLWEGDHLGEAEPAFEKHALEHRAKGSTATVALDSFRLDIERRWCERTLVSRPPSVTPIRRASGKRSAGKARPKILFMPLEFPTWLGGGHSWSYAAALAYETALQAAGCEVTTINTAAAPYHRKILRDQRFDQVWIHAHPRHLSDFHFRQWIGEIAPVRVLLCGESLTYSPEKVAAEPWLAAHGRTVELWAPFLTHALCVDPRDVDAMREGTDTRPGVPAMHWPQAVPKAFVRPVNERPTLDRAVFVGTLYPPRDRWAWDLDGLLEKLDSPESDAFTWLFERSHEWIQRAYDRTQARSPWWRLHALGLYNRGQQLLRRHAFGNFLGALSKGVATVALPSMVQTYSGRVIEGMAAGRPVIAQRIPDHPDVFADELELLHYASAEELGEQIARLKREPSRASTIATLARKNLLANHTVERRTAEILRFVTGEA